MHKKWPTYLLNWKISPNIHNRNIRCTTDIYLFRAKHEFAKRCLRYNFPHVINNTPKIVTEKIGTHSLQGFVNYAKTYLLKNMKIHV